VGGPTVAASGCGINGFPAALTSFVGRAGPVREVVGLLDKYRLVTVTGPGGAGKTRLAGEVAKQVADRYADGVWLVEMAPLADPAQLASVVAAALGVRVQPGMSPADAVAEVLARQQLLLVLDNCEHVIGAAAKLCAGLLLRVDDVRILVTSRESLRVAGEARYRLAPLSLPDPAHPADASGSEAVALFADRARQVDARFVVDELTGPVVADIVTRLDGMPLAIELAAARVEALGVTGLLDRLDERFALLAGADRLAVGRHRSLAATVEWSYQLLDGSERRLFRAVSVFPGPFTLQAAEVVAGEGTELAILRLVDCSLLVPPRPGTDGQPRYGMLQTLRAYGAGLLAEAGEGGSAAAALGRFALATAEEANAGLRTSSGELAAAQRLDAEDATMRQALAWALDHDAATAVRLAVALAPWWLLRDRAASAYPQLSAAAGLAEANSDGWCAAQYWLGRIALKLPDLTGALGHFTAVCDAVGDRWPSALLAACLAHRSRTLSNLGRKAEAVEAGRRSLAMAGELGDPAAEAIALQSLSTAAHYAGDIDDALLLAQQAAQITADIPGEITRAGNAILSSALYQAGSLAAAKRVCADGLARSREVGDLQALAPLLTRMAEFEVREGRVQDASAHLREVLQIIAQGGSWFELLNTLFACAYLCARTGRLVEAVTAGAAYVTFQRRAGVIVEAPWQGWRHEALDQARQALEPGKARAAEDHGAAMSPAAAQEYVLMLTDPGLQPQAQPRMGQLSARERQLVILVAQGRTDAQIAVQLYISIRTVRSHLDRIRDKTGCRRRADLTRLALTEGLV
jgi:predicted ATPase/DNA-binding CsgD family transcriptional regulator